MSRGQPLRSVRGIDLETSVCASLLSRNQGRTKTENEFEKYIRLFVIVPKEMTEKDLTDEFSIYGDLDSISLIRDKSTGERKGFAYVKYHK